jgi:hypothetical protein
MSIRAMSQAGNDIVNRASVAFVMGLSQKSMRHQAAGRIVRADPP